ncbi:MAG: hypothetical protein Q3999_08630 [Buchananella hordeovulneris]|nr:hypothetical protein [Buchananella hordeovulneris]
MLGPGKRGALAIDRVLLCGRRGNVGSARSIQRNGGVLEREIPEEGEAFQRHRIVLN